MGNLLTRVAGGGGGSGSRGYARLSSENLHLQGLVEEQERQIRSLKAQVSDLRAQVRLGGGFWGGGGGRRRVGGVACMRK